MGVTKISQGVVHLVPDDLNAIFTKEQKLFDIWESLTPLSRNEWICWIESAKKTETRLRRIRIMCENFLVGKRRPCCWAGCIHR